MPKSDDNKPITESWLLAIGGKVSADGVICISAEPESGNTVFRSLNFWQGHLCEWWYCAYQRLAQECDRVAMPEVKTRGDVLRICSGLQIQLTKVDD